ADWENNPVSFLLANSLFKKTFYCIKPRFMFRTMCCSCPRHGVSKLLQQGFLFFGQFNGGFNNNPTHQVTNFTCAHRFDTFFTQPELLAGLRTFRDFQYGFTCQSRYFDLTAQTGRGKADWHVRKQVIAITGKYIVALNSYFNVQVTSGGT